MMTDAGRAGGQVRCVCKGAALQGDRVPDVAGDDLRGADLDQQPARPARGRRGHPPLRPAELRHRAQGVLVREAPALGPGQGGTHISFSFFPIYIIFIYSFLLEIGMEMVTVFNCNLFISIYFCRSMSASRR